ncbi:MAG: UvrD-helicase domain-containing protein [Acidobacteria bacterium]|nr:UvrD-helicase domain-containing protein [Acidobacteriota bacterium]
MPVFDPESTPLNKGELIAIEASAGSGKTYTIERLVARLLMHNIVPAEKIVVVTFTKAAATELRARIRRHLLEVLRHAEHDEHDGEKAAQVRQHLANFSQIRISTIHGFAQRTLLALGESVSELEPALNTAEVRTSLLADVLRNLPPDEMRALAAVDGFGTWLDESIGVMMDNPAAEITAVDSNHITELIADITRRVRTALDQRKRQLGVTSYDDLLTRLAVRMENAADRELVAQSIGALLIDEFQDTDALQWESFCRIAECGFLEAFVVVGDPKQAIYGFRGGDVQVYQEAIATAQKYELVHNFRSTTNFIEAENLFFERYTSGSEASKKNFTKNFGVSFDGMPIADGDVMPAHIDFVPVTAAGELSLANGLGPSWRFRRVKATKAASVRHEAFADVARVVAGLLEEVIPDEARVRVDPGAVRPVELDDIVILVAKNSFGTWIAEQLGRAGIPSTVVGGNNVFASEAARQWRYLLNALSGPSEASNVRLYAHSWFGGASRIDVARHRDDESWLAPFQQNLLDWRSLYNEHRDAFFDTVVEESQILIRTTKRPLAERHITDILHVAEVLRTRASDSLAQLSHFLEMSAGTDDGDGASTDSASMSWARRVESDKKTVRIMTIHKAKGLEFPIVLIPFLSTYVTTKKNVATYRLHRQGRNSTILDVSAGTKGVVPGGASRRNGPAIKRDLALAEQRRKGYVAMTRAKVMNIIWTWTGASNSSPLIRDANEVEALALTSPAHFAVQAIDVSETPRVPDRQSGSSPARVLATMSRVLPTPSRQNSYTQLSSFFRVSGSVVQQEADTEPEGSDGVMAVLPTSGFVELASSAQVGRIIHHVMEYLDVTTPDLTLAIREQLHTAVAAEGMVPTDFPFDEAVELVRRAVMTSMGDIAGSRTLTDFATGRIVPELGFDFSIPNPRALRDLHAIVTKHLRDVETFRPWIESLAIDDTTVVGSMTGSMDAVLSWTENDTPQFLVVDYKTNRLRNEAGQEEYSVPTMTSAMTHNHYFLQALIYVVALHRYLRSRLAEYQYSEHIAGAAYLFVRGMDPSSSQSGVLSMTFPEALITEVSEFFEGRTH